MRKERLRNALRRSIKLHLQDEFEHIEDSYIHSYKFPIHNQELLIFSVNRLGANLKREEIERDLRIISSTLSNIDEDYIAFLDVDYTNGVLIIHLQY